MNKLKNLPTPAKYLIGLLILITLLVGGCNWKMESDLSQARAEAKKAGLSLTYAELRSKLPNPSETENAAPVIEKLTALRPNKAQDELAATKLLFKVSPTPAEWQLVESVSPQLDRISRVAEELKGKTAVNFNRKWELGFDVLYPEYAQIRNSIKMLCLKARLLAHKGDRLGAIQLLKSAFHLAELSGNELTLIGLMSTSSNELTCLQTLNLIIGNKPLSPPEKTLVTKIREMLGSVRPMGDYLQLDCASVNMTIESGSIKSLLEMDGKDSKDDAIEVVMRSTLRKVVLAEYLKSITKLYRFCSDKTLSPMELIYRTESFDRTVASPGKYEITKKVALVFLPQFRFIAQSYAKLTAIRRLVDGLLGKPVGVDPYTEAPMKEMRLMNATLFYSVGPNLVDERGAFHDSNGKRISGYDDIAIVVPKTD